MYVALVATCVRSRIVCLKCKEHMRMICFLIVLRLGIWLMPYIFGMNLEWIPGQVTPHHLGFGRRQQGSLIQPGSYYGSFLPLAILFFWKDKAAYFPEHLKHIWDTTCVLIYLSYKALILIQCVCLCVYVRVFLCMCVYVCYVISSVCVKWHPVDVLSDIQYVFAFPTAGLGFHVCSVDYRSPWQHDT